MNRYLPKETHRWPIGTWKDAQQYIKEMEIKTTMRYYLPPARIVKCSRGYGEKETLVKYKNINLKRYMHSNVQSSIIYNSQAMEAI